MHSDFEAEIHEIDIDVVYPDCHPIKMQISLVDVNGVNLNVREVKKTLLTKKNWQKRLNDFNLVVVKKNEVNVLPDDEDIIDYSHFFMSEGDGCHLELKLRQ